MRIGQNPAHSEDEGGYDAIGMRISILAFWWGKRFLPLDKNEQTSSAVHLTDVDPFEKGEGSLLTGQNRIDSLLDDTTTTSRARRLLEVSMWRAVA